MINSPIQNNYNPTWAWYLFYRGHLTTMLKRRRLSLMWTYYKSTLLTNVLCSAAVPFADFPQYIEFFPQMFGLSFITFGLIVSLVYTEFVRKGEYYFYYNASLSRLQLYLACLCINLPVSAVLISIRS